MPKPAFRLQDRYPVSRATRSRWLKDPLLPEPDLVAGGVCYFTDEKKDRLIACAPNASARSGLSRRRRNRPPQPQSTAPIKSKDGKAGASELSVKIWRRHIEDGRAAGAARPGIRLKLAELVSSIPRFRIVSQVRPPHREARHARKTLPALPPAVS